MRHLIARKERSTTEIALRDRYLPVMCFAAVVNAEPPPDLAAAAAMTGDILRPVPYGIPLNLCDSIRSKR